LLNIILKISFVRVIRACGLYKKEFYIILKLTVLKNSRYTYVLILYMIQLTVEKYYVVDALTTSTTRIKHALSVTTIDCLQYTLGTELSFHVLNHQFHPNSINYSIEVRFILRKYFHIIVTSEDVIR